MKKVKIKSILAFALAGIAMVSGTINLIAVSTSAHDAFSKKICAIEEYSDRERVVCEDNSFWQGEIYKEVRITESLALFSTAAILIIIGMGTKKN